MREDEDMIFYGPQNSDCEDRDLVLAKMNFTDDKKKWKVKDDRFNPMYLAEGVHYQQCYYILRFLIKNMIEETHVKFYDANPNECPNQGSSFDQKA